MTLNELGFENKIQEEIDQKAVTVSEIGRVIAEHKERYTVAMQDGILEAEITGNMRFAAESREDFPAVGDWVILTGYDPDFAIIRDMLPRHSMLSRQAVGHFGEIQIIATNIDYAFLVQAVDRDYNINRFERYLTLCYNGKVSPIIVLTKTDLIEKSELEQIIEKIKHRIKETPVLALSNETMEGIDLLSEQMQKGKTYCMLGSSGVGKSTLLNNLMGKTVMKTSHISDSTNKGRHTTSHRELHLLENGAIIIDTPGMREVGVVNSENGLETTFDWLYEYADQCKYRDCSHTQEKGCAIIAAVESGEIDQKAYENYLKMEKESQFFESTVAERKRKEKIFGKIVKDAKKILKK